MQTLTSQAQQTIDYQRDRLSAYMPFIGTSMAKTYGVPFGGLLVAYVAITLLMVQIPGLFSGLLGSVATIAVFFAVIYYGWRWAEARWHGTSLFVEYTAVSKARRTLEAELKLANPNDAVIQKEMSHFVNLTNGFIDTIHGYGYTPEQIIE